MRSIFINSIITGTIAMSFISVQGFYGPVQARSETSSYGTDNTNSSSSSGSDVPGVPGVPAVAAVAARHAHHGLNECGRYFRGKPLIDCVARVLEAYSARLRQSDIPQKAPRAAQVVQEAAEKIVKINSNVASTPAVPAPATTAPKASAPANTKPAAIVPEKTITVTAPPTAAIPREKITVVTQPAPNKSGVIAVLARAASAAASLVAATVMGEGRTVYDLVRGVLTHAKSLVELKG